MDSDGNNLSKQLSEDDPPRDAQTHDISASDKTQRRWINFNLLPLKILMFLMHGGMAALYPYLTLHMKSIGLTFAEIGVISLIVPFVSAIGPPIGGFLADKIGNYKIVLIGFALLSVISHLLMCFAVPSLMPVQSTTLREISSLNVSLTCSVFEDSSLFLAEFPTNCFQTSKNSIPTTISSLEFLDCSTNCPIKSKLSPNICVNGSGIGECFYWKNFERTVLKDVTVRGGANTSWIFGSSTNARQQLIDVNCAQAIRSDCQIKCATVTSFNISCSTTEASKYNRLTVLALYTTFRLLAGIAVCTLFPILDSTAFVMSEEYKGDLGVQRMFSLFGMILMPPLSGYLNGLASKQSGYSNFLPAYCIFATMQLLAAIVTCCMKLSIRLPASDIWRNIGKILKNPRVFTFILMMLFAGIFWGFLENFLFIFMEEDISSPKWLLGLTNTVSGISAIPVIAASSFFMKYLGHTKILILCFLLYGCRFLAYANIYNPFHVLPVEVLEAFTTSLLWVVASVYCGKVAPEYLATLQGVIGCLHYAFGRGVGSLIGGIMFQFLKARKTYIIFGWTSIGVGVFYAVLHYAWLRRIKRPVAKVVAGEEALMGRVPLRRVLTKKEEDDVVQIAKFEALTKTLSGMSGSSIGTAA